ncbi:MAG: hypothetical protein GYA39_02760 [Methanothrix sp.]|nr:hypothetical protein [Methanothrix sp.]
MDCSRRRQRHIHHLAHGPLLAVRCHHYCRRRWRAVQQMQRRCMGVRGLRHYHERAAGMEDSGLAGVMGEGTPME